MAKYRIIKSVCKRPVDCTKSTIFYIEKKGLFSWYRLPVNKLSNRDVSFTSYEDAIDYIFTNGLYDYYETTGNILVFGDYGYYV